MNRYYEKFDDGTVKCIEDEIPFEIPESWAWTRLESLGIFKGGKTPSMHNPKFWNGNINWTTSKDMKSVYISNSLLKITEEALCEMEMFPIGTILFVARSGILKRTLPVAFLTKESTINQDLKALLLYHNNISKYIYYVLKGLEAYILENYVKSVTTVESLKFEEFKRMLIPLPSFSEQKRIVQRIEEIETLIEQYGCYEEIKNQLDKELPNQLKKSILQYAIQGKLTSQNPSDKPASELLKRIRIEKERLIKEKKIKRDKVDSFIFKGDDNKYYERIGKNTVCIDEKIPFEIPDNWEWCRLSSISWLLTDGTHSTPKYTEVGVPFISVKDMSSGKISFDNTKFISETEHKQLSGRCNPQKGDLLISKVGTTGVPVIVDTDKSFSLFVSIALIKFFPQYIDSNYLIYLLQSPLVQEQVKENTRGIGNKNWVLSAIANTLLLLPPKEEQTKIVDKLEITLKRLNIEFTN